MSKFCVVCKKQYIPGDCSSSFHCFPKNSERRQKWMKILGISSFPQNARVCSDHFESRSYHPNDDYTSNLKRLLSNAVPTLQRKILSGITNLQASSSEKSCISHFDHADSSQVMINSNKNIPSNQDNLAVEFVDAFKGDSENTTLKRENVYEDSAYTKNKKFCSTDKHVDSTNNSSLFNEMELENGQKRNVITSTSNVLKRKCSTEIFKIHSTENNCSINTENYQYIANNIIHGMHNDSCSSTIESNRSLKRKCSSHNNPDALCTTEKKFRWKDGPAVKYFTRQDFTSDKAWNDFLKFTVLKRQQREALYKKCKRRKNKINSLNDVIKSLQEKKDQDAAEY